jgi:hypothetical protein
MAATFKWGGAAANRPPPAQEGLAPMQKESHHTRESLAEEVLYAHRLLLDGDGELAGERLLSTIRHMCERVERHEDGWLTVYGQCAEAANVEPHAGALLAAQEAIELVIAGYTIEEDS